MKDHSRKGATAQRKTVRKPSAAFLAPLRRCVSNLFFILGVLVCSNVAFTQTKPVNPSSHPTRSHASMSAEAKALLEDAIGVVCTQAKLDPKSSVAIDEMQARPNLPIQNPDARAGAERAQRLLPMAKALVISSLRQLATEYGFEKSAKLNLRFRQAIDLVNQVKRVRPDMESRDNASVY